MGDPIAEIEAEFSVTWLEKVNGTWRRKQDLNVIETGSLIGLDEAKTPDEIALLAMP